MTPPPTISEIVQFGLTTVPEERVVQVSLRELMFLYNTIGELIRFFHQPDHYPTIESIRNYLGGSGDGGAYDAMAVSYYKKLGGMLPADIQDAIASGAFDHPTPPSYYKPSA